MYGIQASTPVIAAAAGPIDLSNKNVIIVGGTAGIGAALAKATKKAGANVTIIGRTLRDQDFASSFIKADLSLLSEVTRVSNDLPFESTDYLVFTAGIVPGSKKATTVEGVEMDMAASALNRQHMLTIAAPRLKKSARVLIWGFPGSKGAVDKAKLSDFNSESSYEGEFGFTHMNTVALNEALVCHYATLGMNVYGFNPGLIQTDIRSAAFGGCIGAVFECCISCWNPTADAYSAKLLPLFVAPELETNTGVFFGQNGRPIKRSPIFEDPAKVKEWIDAGDALIKKTLSSNSK